MQSRSWRRLARGCGRRTRRANYVCRVRRKAVGLMLYPSATCVVFLPRHDPSRSIAGLLPPRAMLLFSVFYYRGVGSGGMIMSCHFREGLDFRTIQFFIVGGAVWHSWVWAVRDVPDARASCPASLCDVLGSGWGRRRVTGRRFGGTSQGHCCDELA